MAADPASIIHIADLKYGEIAQFPICIFTDIIDVLETQKYIKPNIRKPNIGKVNVFNNFII